MNFYLKALIVTGLSGAIGVLIWAQHTLKDSNDGAKMAKIETQILEVARGANQLVAENKALRAQIAEMKRRMTPQERCLKEKLFTPSMSAPLAVCTKDEDFVIAPLLGRYILFRGLGCGETFEDSFLMFKTVDDANAFIAARVCELKETK